MMDLQELLFPNMETCPTFEMYFRTNEGSKRAWADSRLGAIRVPRWCALELDTYFNSFSVGKWRKYTRLKTLRLRRELSGAFRVQLVHWQKLKGQLEKAVLAERVCESAQRQAFELDFPGELPARGVVAASLYAVGENCAFYGGEYQTDADEDDLNPVDIALDICTYRREKYVERNIAMLKRDIMDDPACELGDHLEVFICDNGRTLERNRFEDDRVHVFPNRNVGGAGGFTRGMIEVIDSPRRFTHVLLMDDDVLVNPDALLRTYRLLRLLKPEYAGKTVAGALMRLDDRCVQYENAAVWTGEYVPVALKGDLDMRKVDSVVFNEQEETASYSGWWFSCIPMAKIDNDNLPLPLFVHRDDIEFGMRTGSDILTLNGVCIWHETFDNKYASSLLYYEVRNDLILNALRLPKYPAIGNARTFLRRSVGNIVRYRYGNCELMRRGLDDFLAGPDKLIVTDPEALNAEIMAASDVLKPVEELDMPFDEASHEAGIEKRKDFVEMARLFFMNGLFLPAQGTAVVNIATSWPRNFYRKKAVLNYDETTGKGFVSRRDFKASVSALLKAFGAAWRLLRGYDAAAKRYREAEPILTSRSFWNEYLGLK